MSEPLHGPRDIAATARKYMITLREEQEDQPVGSKRRAVRPEHMRSTEHVVFLIFISWLWLVECHDAHV